MKTKLKKLIAWPLIFAILSTAIFTNMWQIPDAKTRSIAVSSEAENLINLELITAGDNILEAAKEFEVNSATGILKFAGLVNSGADFEGKTVYLKNDIDDMLETVAESGLLSQTAIGNNAHPFKGTFDGGGFNVNLISIGSLPGEPGGFFGTTEDAVIKNLVIDNGQESGSIENYGSRQYFGAIVGKAVNTVIVNSVNKADITNITAGGTAAGIVALGDEDTKIINCFNYGTITADFVAGIVASEIDEVNLCINLGELDGESNEDSNVENWLEFETANWMDLYGLDIDDGWESLDISDKKEIVTIFNTRVHELKHIIRENDEYEYENRLFLFYWGFYIEFDEVESNYVEADDYLMLCFPRTYIEYMIQKGVRIEEYEEDEEDGEEEEFSGVMPLLGMTLMSEFLSKNAAASSIAMWFKDSYAFITGDEEESADARNDMKEAYFELLVDLEDMSIGDDTDDITKIFSFAKEVEKFVKHACEGVIDGIFYDWEEWYEGQYEDAIFEFAEGIITNWYEDCKSFITGDDEDAIDAREALLVKYNERISGLDEIEFSDNNELLIKINVYILVSLNELDDIYYSWELSVSWAILNEAYEDILNSASSGNKAKVEAIYAEAEAKIKEAEDAFEDYEDIDGERINKWIEYTSAVDDAVNEAVAQFDALELKWSNERTTITWVSVASAIVLTAGIIVVMLLIVMRKRAKNYKAIIVEIQDDRRNKKIWQKADNITRESEARREKEEQRAEVHRLKAEQILKEHREKIEKAEQANSGHSAAPVDIHKEKLEQMEQARSEKLEQMAQAHREKALAAKRKKKK
ncbi:MAG: hypothetical protein FWG51_00590 [Firmicutes bacterium]|nr:hypothetical protein [Bacillota bacterium]